MIQYGSNLGAQLFRESLKTVFRERVKPWSTLIGHNCRTYMSKSKPNLGEYFDPGEGRVKPFFHMRSPIESPLYCDDLIYPELNLIAQHDADIPKTASAYFYQKVPEDDYFRAYKSDAFQYLVSDTSADIIDFVDFDLITNSVDIPALLKDTIERVPGVLKTEGDLDTFKSYRKFYFFSTKGHPQKDPIDFRIIGLGEDGQYRHKDGWRPAEILPNDYVETVLEQGIYQRPESILFLTKSDNPDYRYLHADLHTEKFILCGEYWFDPDTFDEGFL